MSKSRPKSQAKSRKRSLAAKTVKEQKSFFHFCWEFFLLLLSRLWQLARKLFGESLGLIGKKKEPSLSLERPDDTSSAARGASGAAKRASEEQTEEPASEMFSPGTVTDKDPCDDPKSTVHSTEALTLDPEVVGAVFSSEHNGIMVGGHFCPYQAGYRHSYEEHAKLHFLERLHVNEDEIKSERSRSDSGYSKKVFDETLILRQAYSDFEKREEFEDMNIEIKEEVLKLLEQETGKNRKFKEVVRKTSYTKILRTMHFQKKKMSLKLSFESIEWRKDNRFPKFCNDGPEYKWWEKNYVPEILEKRLEILREAAKKWNSEQDIFMVIELVTDLNSTLHPQTSGMGTVEMFRLASTIYSVRSGGDWKI